MIGQTLTLLALTGGFGFAFLAMQDLLARRVRIPVRDSERREQADFSDLDTR